MSHATQNDAEATSARLTHTDLRQFTGDLVRYRHALHPQVIYTPGVQYVADKGGAYWLIDAIASYFGSPPMNAAIASDARIGSLQFWRLAVTGSEAVLTAAGRCRRRAVHPAGDPLHGLSAGVDRHLGRLRRHALDALPAVRTLTLPRHFNPSTRSFSMLSLPLHQLTVSETHNVRKTDRSKHLDELVASIAAHGLLENLLVVETGGPLRGHRRRAASGGIADPCARRAFACRLSGPL